MFIIQLTVKNIAIVYYIILHLALLKYASSFLEKKIITELAITLKEQSKIRKLTVHLGLFFSISLFFITLIRIRKSK